MKKLIITGIIVALFVACGGSSVDKSISKVEKAIEKVEKNKGKMTEADWEALAKEVEEPLKVIADALEKDKVGLMGKMKIIAVTAKWATVLAEAGIGEMGKRLGEAGKELEKANQELQKSDFQKEIENAVKEFEKAAKELEKAAAEQ